MRRRLTSFLIALPVLAVFTHCQNMGRTMSITSIDPSGGSTLGGQEVTISGRNFPEGSVPVVTFGAGSATVTSVTSTAIVVTTPASTGGVTEAVDVTVTDALGKSAESREGFTYR
nr:IPT/TIG domain-containing protein [bacterium]